jgi:hypothetical protein
MNHGIFRFLIAWLTASLMMFAVFSANVVDQKTVGASFSDYRPQTTKAASAAAPSSVLSLL